MPLTIIPLPILGKGELRVDAKGEAEDSQDDERYANAQNDWDLSGGVYKIWLGTWGGFPGWQCLQYGCGNAFNELRINITGRHDYDDQNVMV